MLDSRQRSLFYMATGTTSTSGSPGRVSPRDSSAPASKQRSSSSSIPHPLYAELSLNEQIRQTVESIRFFVEHFDLDHRAFAFPHSDAGRRAEFLKEMRDTSQLRVSFGVAWTRGHFFPRNLERFSMGNSSLPAAQIIRMSYLRGMLSREFASS